MELWQLLLGVGYSMRSGHNECEASSVESAFVYLFFRGRKVPFRLGGVKVETRTRARGISFST